MTSLEYLKALLTAIGVKAPNEVLLQMLIDEAEIILTDITNRKNYEKYPTAIARIAFYNYQNLGDESKESYSAGGVSISYKELKTALKDYLPLPLIKVGNKTFENPKATEVI